MTGDEVQEARKMARGVVVSLVAALSFNPELAVESHVGYAERLVDELDARGHLSILEKIGEAL